MTPRTEVFSSVESERRYQDRRWNALTTSTAGRHSVPEWLLFMREYLDGAIAHVSRNGEPGASEHALHEVRKVVAMGVACMEQHGAPRREGI